MIKIVNLLLLAAPLSFAGCANNDRAVVLDMKIQLNGDLDFQPKVIATSGETAIIESTSEEGHGISIEVTPTLLEEGQVHMSFVVARLDSGKKTILSEPKIISHLGESAKITQGTESDSLKTMSLAVTATVK